MTKDVLELMSSPAGESAEPLTARQREVLRLVVEGRRMKDVAALLDISNRTVETIKYEMMRNLNLHSTAALVRYALEYRLVPF